MTLRKALTWGARGLILAAILWFLLPELQYSLIAESFLRIPPIAFAVALVLQAATQALQAWRWKLLANDTTIPYREYFSFVCLGGVIGILSPATVLSDGVNAYLLGKRHKLIARSFLSIFLGRVLGILCLGLAFLATLPSHAWIFAKLDFQARPGLAALAAAGVALAAAAGGYLAYRRFRDKARAHAAEALRIVSDAPRMALGFAQSMAIQLLTLLIGWLGFWWMDVPVTFSDVLFFGSLVTVISLVPVSIGQVGVREGVNIFFYSLLPGVHKEHVLANIGYAYTLLVLVTLCNLGAWQLLKQDPPARPG